MTSSVLYAHKSSEADDAQALSITAQVQHLLNFAEERRLHVAKILYEAASARAPGRAVFPELLKLLEHGKATGILCWKLDRLARNPVDGGALIWALDQGQLQHVVTPQRIYTNTPNDKFWMQLEFGMAKKYVDDLSVDVKRGMQAKLDQGWLPGRAPLGYRNDVVQHTVVPDPERFPLVRRMRELVLGGTTVPEIRRIATEQWRFAMPRSHG